MCAFFSADVHFKVLMDTVGCVPVKSVLECRNYGPAFLSIRQSITKSSEDLTLVSSAKICQI